MPYPHPSSRAGLAFTVAGVLLVATACGPTAGDEPMADGGPRDTAVRDAPDGGLWGFDASAPDAPAGFVGAVYAHSSDRLYTIDPDTLDVTLVGPFQWPSGSDQMTDIALDATGNMVGISYDTVYSVDKATAACTRLASLDRMFNGLSFVPGEEVGSGQEILVGAALDGSVYRIDKTTGASTAIGNYAGGLGSSGDLVSVKGFGTVATVSKGGSATDWLARVDPTTGVATLIGDTGVDSIWGLGFWKDQVFGFTEGNQFVLIDVHTGVATLVETGDVSWWGAGVTTSAPYIE